MRNISMIRDGRRDLDKLLQRSSRGEGVDFRKFVSTDMQPTPLGEAFLSDFVRCSDDDIGSSNISIDSHSLLLFVGNEAFSLSDTTYSDCSGSIYGNYFKRSRKSPSVDLYCEPIHEPILDPDAPTPGFDIKALFDLDI